MTKQKKILMIDDEAINRELVHDILEDQPFEFIEAANCDQGLLNIGKEMPDLILLDVNMPEKNGFQTLQEIKSNPIYEHIPVIFLSALGETNLKVKGLDMGALDYITRPFHKDEFLARIRATLRNCRGQKRRLSTLEGELSDFSLLELLQTIELGKKTAVITLTDSGGVLILEKGALVHCNLGYFTGENALHRMLLLENGGFRVKFNKIPSLADKKRIPIMEFVMNSTTYIDELNSMINDFGSEAYVKITNEVKLLNGASSFKKDEVVPLRNLIVLLEGDLKECITVLMKLKQTGNLILVDN